MDGNKKLSKRESFALVDRLKLEKLMIGARPKRLFDIKVVVEVIIIIGSWFKEDCPRNEYRTMTASWYQLAFNLPDFERFSLQSCC